MVAHVHLNRHISYRMILLWGLVILTGLALVLGTVYLFLKRWEEELILERKAVCVERAEQIARQVEGSSDLMDLLAPLLKGDTIFLATSRAIEEAFTEIVNQKVGDTEGLEGGFYIRGLDDFVGYAYPTSEPPIPAYGPPPRSYHIIREQVLNSIQKDSALVDLHRFDPAVFPLATHPFSIRGEVAGAVWVRIHIERDLPVAKLRQVLYLVTVIFGIGFVVMAILTLFLRNGIRSIQKELNSTRTNPGYRLKLRGGLFGFIPLRINVMLDMIKDEYEQRLGLEMQLHHKDKLASLGKMIAGVAHEVRTPMSVIKTRLQMWEVDAKKHGESGLDPEVISMVVNEINRVADLMKRLQVFSRPIYDHLKPTSVNEVIEEVLSMMDFGKYGKQIHVNKSLCEHPQWINSDPNSLKQVLINVLINAAESLDESGDILIETACESAENLVTIKISDTGPGIDEDILEHIFEPFYSTKETGTGLGLSISNEIVISFGGEISFRRNEPRGTICFITLPRINHKP